MDLSIVSTLFLLTTSARRPFSAHPLFQLSSITLQYFQVLEPNTVEAEKRLQAKTDQAEKQANHMKARMHQEILAAKNQLRAAQEARDTAEAAEAHAEDLRRLAEEQLLRAKREQEAAEQAKREQEAEERRLREQEAEDVRRQN